MFQELMPLLAQRILLLTLSRVSDEQISANIIPKPLKSDQQDDGSALTTPLRVTGTPKELDEQGLLDEGHRLGEQLLYSAEIAQADSSPGTRTDGFLWLRVSAR